MGCVHLIASFDVQTFLHYHDLLYYITYFWEFKVAFLYIIMMSESKRSPGTDFASGDMKENIRAILVYTALNF